jgi:aspartyl-tRNA(Asn)/glutamyl-tRNA(Gln) amidotransferase subunit C
MSKLSISEVEHIARLSRLELTPGEKEKFANQLSGVLEYVSQLNEVDTAEVEPTAQVTGLQNIYAKDQISNPESQLELLNNTPKRNGSSIQIPAVFGEE